MLDSDLFRKLIDIRDSNDSIEESKRVDEKLETHMDSVAVRKADDHYEVYLAEVESGGEVFMAESDNEKEAVESARKLASVLQLKFKGLVNEGIEPDENKDDEGKKIQKLTEDEEPEDITHEEPEPEEPEEEPKVERPETDEPEAPEITKEYIGNTEDSHYYLISTEDNEGNVEDLQIVDQEGVEKFSAKKNSIDVNNVPEFLFKGIKELRIESIEFGVFEKYLFPYVFEEKEEEEEESKTEEELEELEEPEEEKPVESKNESKINETVQELVRETPGINRQEQEILDWAIENNVISNEWPSDAEMIDALSKFESLEDMPAEDPEGLDLGEIRAVYLKYILLPMAQEKYDEEHVRPFEHPENESKTVEEVINVYKTVSGSRTGITEEELVRKDGKFVDSTTGEDVILDKERSGSAMESTNESKDISDEEIAKVVNDEMSLMKEKDPVTQTAALMSRFIREYHLTIDELSYIVPRIKLAINVRKQTSGSAMESKKHLVEMKITDHQNNVFDVYLVDDGTADTIIDINGKEFRFNSEFVSYWRDEEGNLSEEGLEQLALDALSNMEEDEYNELVVSATEQQTEDEHPEPRKGLENESKVDEDVKHLEPGVYKVTFFDGSTGTVKADSKVDAMKKAREENPEKRVSTVVLLKSTGKPMDYYFNRCESKLNEAPLSTKDVKALFKSIDPAFAKHLTGMSSSKKAVALAGQLVGLKLSEEGKKVLEESKVKEGKMFSEKPEIEKPQHTRAEEIAYNQSKDQIPGGLADDKSTEDFDPEQLEMGIEVEMEHTDDPKKAREIAMDHLTEDPEYYTHLRSMEMENESILQENEAESAKKMQQKGYNYILVFPEENKIEPLYTKTVEQASALLREEYKNIKNVLIQSISKYLESSKEMKECVCHIYDMKDDELLKFYKGMEESYVKDSAIKQLPEDKREVEVELKKRGLLDTKESKVEERAGSIDFAKSIVGTARPELMFGKGLVALKNRIEQGIKSREWDPDALELLKSKLAEVDAQIAKEGTKESKKIEDKDTQLTKSLLEFLQPQNTKPSTRGIADSEEEIWN